MANPNTAVFPGAIPDNNVLPVADDTFFATLSATINGSVTNGYSFSVGITNLPSIVVIDQEIILVQTMSGSTVLTSVRGFGGSTSASHTGGSNVFGYIVSYHNNQIIAELISVCDSLGVSLANIISSGQAAGGDLSGTCPNPNVATVGGVTAGTIAAAVTNLSNAYYNILPINNVTFSATPTFNMALGAAQKITLTGNVTSSTITNLVTGQRVLFVLIQDSTGGRSFVWPTNVFGAITVGSATSNQHCLQEFFSPDGTNLYATSIGTII